MMRIVANPGLRHISCTFEWYGQPSAYIIYLDSDNVDMENNINYTSNGVLKRRIKWILSIGW
jgi:hypothetical protein